MTKTTNVLFRKIIEYAQKTGIQFHQTHRYNLNRSMGIPDVRGFGPHLRTVNLTKGQSRTKSLTDPWVIHDILHIMFYDYVYVHLGTRGWSERTRFYENHLASEAFAVLALDYHILSFEKRGGLAADVSAGKWTQFQATNPDLPHFLSPEFCRILTNLYLSGTEEPFALESLDRPFIKSYGNWLGHEVRYSEKQRYYVGLWWSDLNQESSKGQGFILNHSEVHFAIWELLDLLLYRPRPQWQAWVNKVSGKCKKTGNYFSRFPKFKKAKTKDFRFTSIDALSFQEIEKYLRESTQPNSSSIFLFWQLVTKYQMQDPAIRKLAKSSQTAKPDINAWKKVQKLCLEAFLKSKPWKPQPKNIANFYLP